MSQTIEALIRPMNITSDSSISDSNLSFSVHDQNFNNLVSSTFTKISETDTDFNNIINTLSQSPQFNGDPEKLIMLQSYIGEYSNYISLVSTLARKGVNTIETLEKSQ